jgi:hypothetical protein
MVNVTGALDMLSIMGAIISFLLVTLISVLAWVGLRVHNKLDAIDHALISIERGLRDELTELDRRVHGIETIQNYNNVFDIAQHQKVHRQSRKEDKKPDPKG